MADAFVTVGTDKLQTVRNTVGANDVDAEAVYLVDTSGVPITTLSISGTVTTGGLTDTQLRATALPVSGTFWQATQPVSIAATVATKETRAATPTQSSVANSLSSVTLLASNANRLGATIYNDDTTAILKVKLGATASSTSFTIAMAAGGYYEVPFGYTGVIDGIASAASGNARITELTA